MDHKIKSVAFEYFSLSLYLDNLLPIKNIINRTIVIDIISIQSKKSLVLIRAIFFETLNSELAN